MSSSCYVVAEPRTLDKPQPHTAQQRFTCAFRSLSYCMHPQQCMEAQMQHALLPPNHPYTIAVRRIGARLAKVAAEGKGGGEYQHMQNLDWEYAVIKSDIPNAFVVPGGKVGGGHAWLGDMLAHSPACTCTCTSIELSGCDACGLGASVVAQCTCWYKMQANGLLWQ